MFQGITGARDRLGRALARFDRAPKSKPKEHRPKSPPRFMQDQSRAEARANQRALRRGHRQDIRTAVFLRATENGRARCEGPLASDPLVENRHGFPIRCMNDATELLHVFGRGKGRMPESERNCLAACHSCHVTETRNQPSGAAWWAYFARFFVAQGFHFEADEALKRARTAEVKANLPAASRAR